MADQARTLHTKRAGVFRPQPLSLPLFGAAVLALPACGNTSQAGSPSPGTASPPPSAGTVAPSAGRIGGMGGAGATGGTAGGIAGSTAGSAGFAAGSGGLSGTLGAAGLPGAAGAAGMAGALAGAGGASGISAAGAGGTPPVPPIPRPPLPQDAPMCNQPALYAHPDNGVSKPFVEHLDYFPPGSIDFDSKNRPYMINNNTNFGMRAIHDVITLRNGIWTRFSYLDELQAAYPNQLVAQYPLQPGQIQKSEGPADYWQTGHTKGDIVIDDRDAFYALVAVHRQAPGEMKPRVRWTMIYAPNIADPAFNGDFQVLDALDGASSSAFMETRNSFNDVTTYPPIVGFGDPTANYPNRPPCASDSLAVFSKTVGGRLTYQKIPGPGMPYVTQHSGGHSVAVTAGSKTFIVYQKMMRDAQCKLIKSGDNIQYLRILDRVTNTFVGQEQEVFTTWGSGGKQDAHNTPVAAIDRDGFLHLLAGGHASALKYVKSAHPVDSNTTQVTFEPTADVKVFCGPQNPRADERTYSELLIDWSNAMHSMYRGQVQGRESPYQLLYERRPAAQSTWATHPRLFADQPGSNHYRVYRHRLHKDRHRDPTQRGLFANWTAFYSVLPDGFIQDRYRVLTVSRDRGTSWEIPTRHDFLMHQDDERRVQRIAFEKPADQSAADYSPSGYVTLQATTNAPGLPLLYEVVEGPAIVQGDRLLSTGNGTVTVRVYNEGNTAYFADEAFQSFTVAR